MRWLRNTIAAFFFAFARSTKLATEATVVRPPLEPITTPIRKRYEAEVTIAGGPGSQRIGDTFDALPQEVKDAFLAARKGTIRRAPIDEWEGFTGGASSTDKIARGLARARGQHYALNERGQTVRTTAPDKNPRPRTETETEV